ncbi:hypothetical protein [Erythrobacter crassostreae]|uniref:Uncharacterized protein n=1 Tax=Erythrobacter crassostreae TaxID=2828328 RepID=A0A9X1JQE0_9SPHN|nr:hypothetical protein [Erythrobacter crassostrea]MBV7260302.1 hypothetical protein [Erythrobacter crassostrea]
MTEHAEPKIALKSGVFYSAFDQGVVFRGGETPVILRGKNALRLVTPVVAAMENGVTKSGLLELLPEPVRPVVLNLLNDLQESNLLRQRRPTDSNCEDDLDANFNSFWLFLRDNLKSPGDALQKWLSTQFVIQGDLDAVAWMVEALADTAARNIAIMPLPKGDLDEVDRLLTDLRARHPHIQFDKGADAPEFSSTVRILAGGRTPDLARECDWSDGWYFGVLSGHLVSAKVDGSFAERLSDWNARLTEPERAVRSGRVADNRFKLAASSLAFGILCDEVGMANTDQSDDWLFVTQPALRLRALSLPRPVSFAASAEEAAVADEELDIDAKIDLMSCVLDPVTGFLDRLDDEEQVPLSVVRYRVRGLSDGAQNELIVSGWGMTHQEATLAGLQAGVEVFLTDKAREQGLDGFAGVGWSPEDAIAASNRRIVEEGLVASSEHPWEALPLEDIDDAECWRLARLLEMVSGATVTLKRSVLDGGYFAAKCAVGDHPEQVAAAPQIAEAAWQALGTAACALQQVSAQPAGSFAGPVNQSGGSVDLQVGLLTADLGYSELDGKFICKLSERRRP